MMATRSGSQYGFKNRKNIAQSKGTALSFLGSRRRVLRALHWTSGRRRHLAVARVTQPPPMPKSHSCNDPFCGGARCTLLDTPVDSREKTLLVSLPLRTLCREVTFKSSDKQTKQLLLVSSLCTKCTLNFQFNLLNLLFRLKQALPWFENVWHQINKYTKVIHHHCISPHSWCWLL